MSKAEHLISFWYRGPGELVNGLFVSCETKYFNELKLYQYQLPKTLFIIFQIEGKKMKGDGAIQQTEKYYYEEYLPREHGWVEVYHSSPKG